MKHRWFSNYSEMEMFGIKFPIGKQKALEGTIEM